MLKSARFFNRKSEILLLGWSIRWLFSEEILFCCPCCNFRQISTSEVVLFLLSAIVVESDC